MTQGEFLISHMQIIPKIFQFYQNLPFLGDSSNIKDCPYPITYNREIQLPWRGIHPKTFFSFSL